MRGKTGTVYVINEKGIIPTIELRRPDYDMKKDMLPAARALEEAKWELYPNGTILSGEAMICRAAGKIAGIDLSKYSLGTDEMENYISSLDTRAVERFNRSYALASYTYWKTLGGMPDKEPEDKYVLAGAEKGLSREEVRDAIVDSHKTSPEYKKSSSGKWIGLGAALAGAAVLGGVFLVGGVGASNPNPPEPTTEVLEDTYNDVTGYRHIRYSDGTQKYINVDDPDLDKVSSKKEIELGGNPQALDLYTTCFTDDIKKEPSIKKSLEEFKYNLKNKVNFVNLDGSKGINVHLPEKCEAIPEGLSFAGAFNPPLKRGDLFHEGNGSFEGTSMGQYIIDKATPVDGRIHTQIFVTSFENSGFEEAYAAFPTGYRQIVVDSYYGSPFWENAFAHETGNLFGIPISSKKGSVMGQSTAGNIFYDNEWVGELEKKKELNITLFGDF